MAKSVVIIVEQFLTLFQKQLLTSSLDEGCGPLAVTLRLLQLLLRHPHLLVRGIAELSKTFLQLLGALFPEKIYTQYAGSGRL